MTGVRSAMAISLHAKPEALPQQTQQKAQPRVGEKLTPDDII